MKIKSHEELIKMLRKLRLKLTRPTPMVWVEMPIGKRMPK